MKHRPTSPLALLLSALFFGGFLAHTFAVLPPSAYESLQKEAPEILEIEILRIKREPSASQGKEEITLTAAVVSVKHSSTGLTPGDSIQIRYLFLLPEAIMPGAPLIPIPPEGKKTIAFLKKKDGKPYYEPAAEAMSFDKF